MATKKPNSQRREVDVQPLAARISWWALVAAVVAVPVSMSNVTWLGPTALPFTSDQFELVKFAVLQVCIVVSLGAWATWQAQTGKLVVRHTVVNWIVLALLAWMSLATLTALNPTSAFFGQYGRYEGLLTFFDYGLLYFMALQLCASGGRVRTISSALLVSAGIVAGYALVQRLGADPLRWVQAMPPGSRRIYSTYGNVDMLGSFLVFPLAIAPAVALSAEKTWVKIAAWIVAGVVAAAWVITLVRGAWIGGLVALLVLAFAAWWLRPAWSRVDLGALAAGGVVLITGLVLASVPGMQGLSLLERLRSLSRPGEGSIFSRLQIWRGALAAIGDRPILGSGPDSFDYAFRRHQSIELLRLHGRSGFTDNAHSVPIQLAVTAGVPGALLGVTAFAAPLALSVKSVFVRDGGARRLLVVAWWAACAGYIVNLLGAVSVPSTTFLLWIGLAIVVAPGATSLDLGKRLRVPVAIAVAVICVLGVVFASSLLAADNAELRSGVAPDQPAALALADRAVSLAPWQIEYRTQRANLVSDAALQKLTALQSTVKGRPLAQQSGLDGAIEARTQLVTRNPWVYNSWVNLAIMYNTAVPALGRDSYVKAEAAARKALAIDPGGSFAHLNLAEAHIGLGRSDEAIHEAKLALDSDPTFAEASLTLGRLYSRNGDVAGARRVYTEALANRPAGDASQEYAAVQEALQALAAPGK